MQPAEFQTNDLVDEDEQRHQNTIVNKALELSEKTETSLDESFQMSMVGQRELRDGEQSVNGAQCKYQLIWKSSDLLFVFDTLFRKSDDESRC